MRWLPVRTIEELLVEIFRKRAFAFAERSSQPRNWKHDLQFQKAYLHLHYSFMIFPTSVKIRPLSRDIVRTESPSTSCSMDRTPLDNIIVLVSFFKTECSRRNQIRQTKTTKYSTVLHPSLMAFLMTPRLVWMVEVPLKHLMGHLGQ